MKKIFILFLFLSVILITGCKKESSDTIFKNLTNKIDKLDSYMLEGTLSVKNNKDSYTYDVKVDYMKKDKFKVSLINSNNNHEQVILRNDEGVYVLTPSLNKSFKFQSDWPYNNSQIYLLGSIIENLNSDSNLIKEEKDGKFIFTSKVNYPNNTNLIKQKVYVKSDLLIEKVEVLNENDEVEMSFTITNIDYDPTFSETHFEVNSIINTNNQKEDKDKNKDKELTDEKTDNENNSKVEENTNENTKTEKTATIEDVIYPLYLPTGTYLEEQEKVSKTDGERIILTFSGEKGFTLVEETVSKEEEFTVIPTYGEPAQVNDTIGAMTDNSLNWISGNMEYYLVSDVMNCEELLNIANSISLSESVASLK